MMSPSTQHTTKIQNRLKKFSVMNPFFGLRSRANLLSSERCSLSIFLSLRCSRRSSCNCGSR